MLTTVLGLINYGVLLIFGVFVSAAFLDISFNCKNLLKLSLLSFGIIALQFVSYAIAGYEATQWIYPVIAHLPIVLFFRFCYKRAFLSSALAVMSAYLCCQISKWLAIIVLSLGGEQWLFYSVRILINVAMLVFLIRFAAPSIRVIFSKPQKAQLTLGILPIAYYVFDYGTTVYTDLLYRGNQAVFEFLPFMLCIAYLTFSMIYFKQYEEKQKAQQLNRMMEMQWAQSAKEIGAFKRSEHAVSLLRHDMRHFLQNIAAYIDSGEGDKAKEYIGEIISSTDQTAMHKYCKNEIVNMILSSHDKEITDNQIDFDCSIQIPEFMNISDVDLTSILSNALENAIHAVLPLDADKRRIVLDLRMNGKKLLISVKNTFAEQPEMADGIPISRKAGHGFGTQSICYVTEKMNGNCQFTVNDDWFILRIIL